MEETGVIRKLTKKKRNARYDANAAAVREIYDRATQGVSLASPVSDPARAAKIQAEAQKRREGRPTKTRVLRPTKRTITEHKAPVSDYVQLRTGQVVGHPEPMRTVKERARQTRLRRRAAFRRVK
jgi:hypothetical protein